MSFEVRTEFGNLDPEAKRALVAMQHAIKGHLDEQAKANRRPKRPVTELVEEGSVLAKPGQVVRVQPSDEDIEVVLPPSDPGNGGEDIIVSFEGDGTATGKVLVTSASGTCANPGTTTLNTPGSYRFTSTGAPSEGELAEDASWSGPAPLSLDDLPEVAPQRLLGNDTGATAAPTELTTSQVLDWVGSTRGSVLERGAAGWTPITPGAIELPIVSKGAGADPVYQQLATAGIADDAVTNAKLGNMAQSTVKLRAAAAGTGDPTDGTVTQVLDMVGSTRGSLLERGASAWGVIVPGTTEFPLCSKGTGADPVYQRLANAGLATMVQATIKLRASGAGTGDPIDGTVTQALDMAGSTRGSLLERGSSSWGILTPGTTGLPLVSQGSGADPIYTKITSTGSLLGWDDVLANDVHTGAFTPIIDSGQKILFANAGTSAEVRSTASGGLTLIAPNAFNVTCTTGFNVSTTGGINCQLQGTGVPPGLEVKAAASANAPGGGSIGASGTFWVKTGNKTRAMFGDSDGGGPAAGQDWPLDCCGQSPKTAATTVTNSTTILATTGTLTVEAPALVAGNRFRCTFTYQFVRGATATALNLGSFFNIGGASVSVAQAAQTTAGTYHMRVEAEITILTTGVGGTAMAVITAWGDANTGTNGFAGSADTAFAVDTTANLALSGAAQMNTAVANCQIKATGGHIERLC